MSDSFIPSKEKKFFYLNLRAQKIVLCSPIKKKREEESEKLAL